MRRVALAATLALLGAEAAGACAVCFGDAGDSMTQGMNNGILTLLAVVAIVQIGLAAMFFSFWRRGRELRSRREKFQIFDGGA